MVRRFVRQQWEVNIIHEPWGRRPGDFSQDPEEVRRQSSLQRKDRQVDPEVLQRDRNLGLVSRQRELFVSQILLYFFS